MIHRLRIFALLSLILIANSCKKSTPPEETRAVRTVLAYIAGDNDISNFFIQNVDEMIKGMQGVKNGNLIVYLDLPNFAPQLIKIESNGKRTIVRQYVEENSASAVVLSKAFNDAKALYPADSYGLILSSHGFGWLPRGATGTSTTSPGTFAAASMWYRDPTAAVTKTFGTDDSERLDTGMEISEISAVFPQDKSIDFILFDACFMAGVEVAYELRNTAKYIIGSSAEIMGAGFPYTLLTPKLFTKTADLKGICESFMHHYTQVAPYKSGTISLVDCSELESLAQTVQAIYQANGDATVNPSTIQSYERLSTHIFYDLDNLMDEISPSETLYNDFAKQLLKTVIYSNYTARVYSVYQSGGWFDVNRSCGLTTYIPKVELQSYNTAWEATSWAKRVSNK